MANITASVKVGGKPLKRAFIEHPRMPWQSPAFALTDEEGVFKFDAGSDNEIEVKVHCQNSVIRVVDGESFNVGISINKKVRNGSVIRISGNDHFAILNKCLDVYDTVWRQFGPYRKAGRGAFAIPRQPSLRDTFASNRRLELSYPDHLSPDLAFVEPSGLTNAGLPLTHITNRSRDGRLFGEDDADAGPEANDPSLLPHEMGHVFHFAAMAANIRQRVEGGYVGWLLGQIGSGDFYHQVDKRTKPLIAYLEAVGIFSERFFFFSKRVEPGLAGSALRKAFVDDELSAAPRLPGKLRDGYVRIAERKADGSVESKVPTGNDVEGAVYGAMYLELAGKIGLKTVVEGMLASNATNFDEFARFMGAAHGPAMRSIKANWRM